MSFILEMRNSCCGFGEGQKFEYCYSENNLRLAAADAETSGGLASPLTRSVARVAEVNAEMIGLYVDLDLGFRCQK